jgi:hypothetical protein
VSSCAGLWSRRTVGSRRHSTQTRARFQFSKCLFLFPPSVSFALQPAITESRPRTEGWDPREPRTNEQGPYESTRKQLFECLVWICAPALLHEVVDSKFQVQVFRAKRCSCGECVRQHGRTHVCAVHRCANSVKTLAREHPISSCCVVRCTCARVLHAARMHTYRAQNGSTLVLVQLMCLASALCSLQVNAGT